MFTYQYAVMNPRTNDGQIQQLTIDISQDAEGSVLSRTGLLNGPRYIHHSSERAFERIPMVPVGIAGPEGWIYGLGFDSDLHGFGLWGSFREQALVLPGQTLAGFQLTSYGLPGIRMAQIQPLIDYDNLPEDFTEEPDKVRELRDRLVLHTITVGPKAPPQSLTASTFLDYLITLLNDSRQQGWIRIKGVHHSLLTKLMNAKYRLDAGNSKDAKKILATFLQEVTATSCRQLSCPGNKPLTSEAYALLFFNGQYLWTQL
jgi:hypothetical protein